MMMNKRRLVFLLVWTPIGMAAPLPATYHGIIPAIFGEAAVHKVLGQPTAH